MTRWLLTFVISAGCLQVPNLPQGHDDVSSDMRDESAADPSDSGSDFQDRDDELVDAPDSDIPPGPRRWAYVSAGRDHLCATTTHGELYCWGRNIDGQVNQQPGQPNEVTAPYRVELEDVTSVSPGDDHTCAVAGGEVVCWGQSADGRLGDGVVDAVAPPDTGPTVIAAGARHGCVIDTNTPSGAGVRCWGTEWFSTSVDETLEELAVHSISAGTQATCAITAANALICWGAPANLGLATCDPECIPQPPPTPAGPAEPFTQVDIGRNHACAIGENQTAYCWGDNDHRRVSWDETLQTDAEYPLTEVGTARAIAAGDTHTCRITLGQELACWGENDSGELGDDPANGGADGVISPILLDGSQTWVQVTAGLAFTCAIADCGGTCAELFCWGRNNFGQLGRPANSEDNFVPLEVALPD